MMRLAVTLLAVTMVLIGSTGAFAAQTIAAGPIFVNDSDPYRCAVVNVSTRDVARVIVNVRIDGGAPGVAAACAPLAPASVCEAVSAGAGSSAYRFCEVTVQGSKTAVRATFCDATQGICVPGQ